MSVPLRVLIIEDELPDAELLLRELRRGDFEPDFRRVATAEGLRQALSAGDWDLILCDYTLAGFSGSDALAMVRRMGVSTPLIFVSGTIGEDKAVAAMRAGAQDYVLKDNLKRLLPAIDRELREAALRQQAAQADARRAVAESRVQVLLDMAPDAILTVDAEGRIGTYNRSAENLFGFAPEEIAGAPVEWLLPAGIPADRAARSPGGDAGQQTLMQGRRRDGSEIPIEVSFGEVVEDGRAATMAVIRDIRRRQELEEQLRQAQKMEVVGQLTGGLAHDFNNLLTVIVGNLEAVEQELPTGSRIRRMAELALAAGLRGAALTRQMLAFSRRQTLETQAVDLNGLVAGTVDLLRRTLGDHIAVETELPDGLWTALADPGQVETALLNLALNARDAMPDGGRLRVETANVRLDGAGAGDRPDALSGDYLMLAISDTGTGIAPDALPRVFEPFYTTKAVGLGTGLGLSMVYGFARQSGGDVQIESRPGAGTVVRLYLPRANGSTTAEAGGGAPEIAAPAQGARILVVEDDEDVRATAMALLGSAGYRLTEAADGPTALKMLEAGLQIDLVFTDIAMPGGMSGTDLAAAVQRLHPGMPVLLTTGYADMTGGRASGSGQAAEAWGPVLHKPYRRANLLQMVADALGEAAAAPARKPEGGG
ncbi:response regulator [Marinibaculum pumilum]|uniref:histidine kinase n=1 Tax=Marinibaculum pumilum TaxID=1766165 RepID=A0ABV7LAZ3_9PROT